MSKDYTNEIGYETLLKDFERYQKQTPRGVGMAKKGQNIYLQFKTPNTARKQYACGCSFTLDGMVDALKKSNKVAEALKSFTSETEFWQWYDKQIKGKSQLQDDLITFGEAVKKVEDDFWGRPSRTRRKRDKDNHSDIASWNRTYGCFYKLLPRDKKINLADIQKTIDSQKRGTRNYKYVVFAINRTNLGTTVKTGARIARPFIPPKYPDLLERLEIKIPLLPTNKPNNSSSDTIRRFHAATARKMLNKWNAPFTQTHAFRHLANINGMQAGIPLEVRAQSMGHTPAMNDSVYKKRQSTQTTIDLLLNSNTQAIDFVTALGEAKKLVREDESDKEIVARLASIIYQKNEKEIYRLLWA